MSIAATTFAANINLFQGTILHGLVFDNSQSVENIVRKIEVEKQKINSQKAVYK